MTARKWMAATALATALLAAPGLLLAGAPRGGGEMSRGAAASGDMVRSRDRLHTQSRQQSTATDATAVRSQDRAQLHTGDQSQAQARQQSQVQARQQAEAQARQQTQSREQLRSEEHSPVQQESQVRSATQSRVRAGQ